MSESEWKLAKIERIAMRSSLLNEKVPSLKLENIGPNFILCTYVFIDIHPIVNGSCLSLPSVLFDFQQERFTHQRRKLGHGYRDQFL